MSQNGLRHFLELTDISKAALRRVIDASRAMKAKRRGKGTADRT